MPKIHPRGGGFIVKCVHGFFRKPRVTTAGRVTGDAARLTPPPRRLQEFPQLGHGPDPTDTAMTRANPRFAEGMPYQMNCTNCVVTAEHRIRGLDVTAQPLAWGRPYGTASNQWVKPDGSPVQVHHVGPNSAEAMDGVFPDGARGLIEAGWASNPGAHIWSWEARDGRIQYLDPQSGELDARHYFKHIESGTMWRVDDADFIGFPPEDWMLPHDPHP